MSEVLLQNYTALLEDLKQQVQQARTRAVLSVNRELILLYWKIGQRILEVQGVDGWGAKVIPNLARDLKTAFPDMKGFSETNLKYMKMFAQAYAEISQQAVDLLPWGHIVVLLTRYKDADICSQYVRAASRSYD